MQLDVFITFGKNNYNVKRSSLTNGDLKKSPNTVIQKFLLYSFMYSLFFCVSKLKT